MKRADWIVFKTRLINLVYRVLNRLRFFPFTLAYDLLHAAHKVVHLRTGRGHVRVAEVAGHGVALSRETLVWLNQPSGPEELDYDACILLPANHDANLQDLIAVMLTSTRVRSVSLYWDTAALSDDVPVLLGKQDRRSALASEKLGPSQTARLERFFLHEHRPLDLPVAAVREAQTMLKREVGPGYAVCVNLPAEVRGASDALAQALPDVRFFDLHRPPLRDSGLTLHERMALVQAADAYVGAFDELGCAAVIGRRPSVLWGSPAASLSGEMRNGTLLWIDGTRQSGALQMTLDFLSRHLFRDNAAGFRGPERRALGDTA